ncbi:hypothetical protein [Bacillus wiedmannii]|uniref:hypothetical protein n=1 Tax=Bacillus wiedmannii TaxID=1890302 RepID=UPI003D9785E9
MNVDMNQLRAAANALPLNELSVVSNIEVNRLKELLTNGATYEERLWIAYAIQFLKRTIIY